VGSTRTLSRRSATSSTRVVDDVESEDVIYEVGERVVELCADHPLYE